MMKKSHKKYLDKIHIDPDNPENCALKIKCPLVNPDCEGCYFNKNEKE